MNSIFNRTKFVFCHLPVRKSFGQCSLQQFGGLNQIPSSHYCYNVARSVLIKPEVVSYQQLRHAVSGFFNKHSAEQIWKGVSSVSSAGKRRGRGKIRGKKIIKDLNKGQVIGIGKANIRFPGLSAPIIRGRELIQQHKLPEDKNYMENLMKHRQTVAKARKEKVSPLDRGWTGGHLEGKKLGPPDPIKDDVFKGFESIILQHKPFVHMTSHFGRFRSVFTIVGTGNGNGVFGFALGRAPESKASLNKAKNRAGQRLMYIQRHEERTILHNFTSNFGKTKITAWQAAPHSGLRCHRLLKNICQLIGIKDMVAKVEGGDAPLNIIQSFLLGLLRQKSFEELAAETKLHVVEINPMNDYFPKLLASPTDPIESSEEPLDFDLYCFDNKVFVSKKEKVPYFLRNHQYRIHLKKLEKRKTRPQVKLELITEYGELRSFLTDKFPECKPHLPRWTFSLKKNAETTKEAETKED